MRTSIVAVCCVVLMSLPARAVFLTVSNGDFETGGVSDGVFTNTPGQTPSGWTLDLGGGSLSSFFGYWNPQDDAYAGTSGLPGVTGTMLGPNVFYFGSLDDNQGISQVIGGAAFEAGTDYVLTVALGTRANYSVMSDLRMTIYAGSTEIATTVILASAYATASTAGTFADYSLVYSYDSSDAALAGESLRISFTEQGAGNEVDIDNVRLEAIPEPTTACLFAFSAAFIGVGWRRKSRRNC